MEIPHEFEKIIMLKSTNYWEFILKIKNIVLFLLSTIYLTACGGVTPIPPTETSTQDVAIKTSTPTPNVAATASPTLFYWRTPTPETIIGYPTALMPVESDPFAKNVPVVPRALGIQQLYIGKYIIRSWCKDDESIKEYCAITISSLGEKQVEIWGFPVYLGTETGSDLTGNGYPNIVVISSNGNAGSQIRVFEAGETLIEIMDGWAHNFVQSSHFVDLNYDKSYEFIGDIRIWSKFSICQALDVPLVYEYESETSYINKTSKYKEVLTPNIEWSLGQISTYKTENPNTEIPLCNVYYLVTTYLVSGQTEKAWAVLEENYPAEKVAEYKAGFLKDLGNLVQK